MKVIPFRVIVRHNDDEVDNGALLRASVEVYLEAKPGYVVEHPLLSRTDPIEEPDSYNISLTGTGMLTINSSGLVVYNKQKISFALAKPPEIHYKAEDGVYIPDDDWSGEISIVVVRKQPKYGKVYY